MRSSIFESLCMTQERYPDEAYPKVTVVIPTFNSALALPRTLDSLFEQDYPHLEIIVVDASSEDRTIEAVKNYRDERVKIYSVSYYQPYEMLNKGISLATGEYINFLKPGDYYLFKRALKHVMAVALDTDSPDLIYSASLVRMRYKEVSLLFLPLTIDHLKKGEEPTFIESCFFDKGVFQKLGKFDPSLKLRGDLDLFCRFMLNGRLKYAFTTRVVVDHGEKVIRRRELLQRFKETFKILYRNFGIAAALKWLFCQDYLDHFIQLTFRNFKRAIVGS